MENLVSIQDLPAVFRDKKILVTGHTGFKGSWLCAWLFMMGAKVSGYSLAPEYKGGLYNLLPKSTFNSDVIADIRDKSKLKEVLTLNSMIARLTIVLIVGAIYLLPAHKKWWVQTPYLLSACLLSSHIPNKFLPP